MILLFRSKSTKEWGEPRALFLISLITFTALALVGVSAWGLYREETCPAEIFRETPIAGTDWVAQIRNVSCSFGSVAMIDIRVVKSSGRGATVLATGYDIDLAVLDGTMRNHLRITIPQGRDITIRKPHISGLAVDFIYKLQ